MARIDRAQIGRARRLFDGLPADIQNAVKAQQRAQYNPIWRESVASAVHGGEAVQTKIFGPSGTRAEPGVPARLVTGDVVQRLSGGLIPYQYARSFEFGAKNRGYTTYSRRNRKRGGRHQVRRRTRNQMPLYRRRGWVAYPAFYGEALGRIVSLSVQTVMRRIYQAVEE